MTLPIPYAAANADGTVIRDANLFATATNRPNEVMLGTLLRCGRRGGEIARMYGLPPSAVAHMRDEIGI